MQTSFVSSKSGMAEETGAEERVYRHVGSRSWKRLGWNGVTWTKRTGLVCRT